MPKQFLLFVRRALLLACLGFSLHIGAQPSTPSIEIGFEEALSLAARWIVENHTAEAQQLLDGLGKAYPDHPQVLFLKGQLALIKADYGEAVKLFRRILSRNPDLTRVRLELARALFLARDFDAARYHFEIALGQALEEPVRENIYRFLRAIQGRTSWFTVSAVFGPDSNPTYATRAQTINLFGQTFVLNPDAKAKRAYGLIVDAQGRYVFGEDNRNFVRTAIGYRGYPGAYADYESFEITGGRSLISGQSLWTAEAGPLAARFQHQALYEGGVIRFTHTRPLGERFLASSYLSLKQIEYGTYEYLSAKQVWGGATMRYALNPTSGISGSVSLGNNRAENGAYSYDAMEATLGYSKELPSRFNVEARLTANRFSYDQPAPLFGTLREDELVQIDLDVTARDWSFHGFAPKVLMSVGHNHSTIALYSYDRRFLGIGMTRQF